MTRGTTFNYIFIVKCLLERDNGTQPDYFHNQSIGRFNSKSGGSLSAMKNFLCPLKNLLFHALYYRKNTQKSSIMVTQKTFPIANSMSPPLRVASILRTEKNSFESPHSYVSHNFISKQKKIFCSPLL